MMAGGSRALISGGECRREAVNVETRDFEASETSYGHGGRRELAQQMAAHESPRTTALYDRRDDEVAVDEVERILI